MILVTGGTGLVGGHLLMSLVNAGEKPRALFRSEKSIQKTRNIFELYGLPKNLVDDQIEWVQGDVGDVDELEAAFKGVQQVYHCSALVSFNKKDRADLFTINVEGTANVVNLCLDYKISKLCYVSSTAAIGESLIDGLRTEESQWTPDGRSAYSVSKYYAELEVWRGVEEGLEAVIVNPSVILGPGDWTSGSANLFKKVADGLKFYSTGINGFVDVRDVVLAMTQLMNSSISGERFLVTAENVSFQDLFFQMADALKVVRPKVRVKKWMTAIIWRLEAVLSFLFGKEPLVTKESAESALSIAKYSNEKIQSAIDFKFRSLTDTISETADRFNKSKV